MVFNNLLKDFINSEKSSGLLLLFCTLLSLSLANLPIGNNYLSFWHVQLFGKSLEFMINDGLMSIFFLLVGLEIKREIYIGELSSVKKSLLPALAAIGGMLIPAIIHFAFNQGTVTKNGFGIPMATDIAFSLAILSLLGKRVPLSLKIFLTALAIIDDLGAITIIALFYSKNISLLYLALAVFLFIVMLVLNRMKIHHLWVYLIIGAIMWFFVYHSGIHATIAGVLLAFTIPFGKGEEKSASSIIQHHLHRPVAFFILPLFALVNTAIVIPASVMNDLASYNSYGIILGLVVGKPLGIALFSLCGLLTGLCTLPADIKKQHLLWVGFLAGIGFTMSIFITLMAYDDPAVINVSKIAVIIGSLLSAVFGYFGLKLSLNNNK